jgi:hypothetical protein
MKNYLPTDLGLLGAFGLLIYGGVKQYQVAKKLDMSVTDLSKKTPVEISDAAVNSAVEKAVERETKMAVKSAVKTIVSAGEEEMKKEIHAEVKAQYDDISDKVTKQVSEEVANIDEAKLRKKVEDKAEEIVLTKLEGATDKALNRMSRGIGSVMNFFDNTVGQAGVRNQGKSGLRLTFD